MYQYCAFSSVSPYADAGTLDGYVRSQRGYYINKSQREVGGLGPEAEDEEEEEKDEEPPPNPPPMMSAMEVYVLAMQAARGLHRDHLYDQEGGATHVVADVQPGQFLLFHRNHRIMEEGGSREEDGSTLADDDVGLVARVTTTAVRENADVPILQIQDFNRGRYLTQRYDNATITAITCPFRTCNVRHWGSTYRSPEEYVVPSWDGKGGDCEDQTEAIDVYALRGCFTICCQGGGNLGIM